MRRLLVFLVACGGGDKSPLADQPGLTSIAGTRTMGELSDAEKKQLCEDFKAYQQKVKPTADEMLKMTCQAQAALGTASGTAKDDATLRAVCKQNYDACFARKEPMKEPELDCANPQFLGKMSECKQLTIAEISECVADLASVMKKIAAEDLCGSLSASDPSAVMTRIADRMKSSKCEALEAKCGRPTLTPNATGVADPEVEKATLTALADFKAKMCGCKDKPCAEIVRADMNKWGMDMQAKHPTFKPSDAVTQQILTLVNDYTNCMLIIAGDNSGKGSAR